MKRLFCFVLAATLVGICSCSRQEKDTPKTVIENPQAQEKDPPKPPEEPGGEKDAKKDDAKKEGIVWNMDYLDKTWGIKVKSVQVNKIQVMGKDSESPLRVASLLCEFSKDLPVEATVNDGKVVFFLLPLKEMRAALSPKSPSPMLYYLFDAEDIILSKSPAQDIVGELTGKKGDAFRLILQFSTVPPVSKVEARPK
jgi:hypothetical protein